MAHSEDSETLDREGAELHVRGAVVMAIDGGVHRSPIAPSVADPAPGRWHDPCRPWVGDRWRGTASARPADAWRPDPETDA
ncbi:MAG TPA: hypothetical protein DDZ76_15440 [Xanthomonadales bacterium]|nr:hypothetical protein [Xanthomonadales bacterium]